MKKEHVELLFDVLDDVFNQINTSNKAKGTGLSFGYKLEVTPPDAALKKPLLYTFDVVIRESGHGERTLQQFTYEKPEGYDAHHMKFSVMQAVITVMFESTMLHWNELGKLLNTDKELQKSAIIL